MVEPQMERTSSIHCKEGYEHIEGDRKHYEESTKTHTLVVTFSSESGVSRAKAMSMT
jgi:hypothetical protein